MTTNSAGCWVLGAEQGSTDVQVDRCICADISFADLVRLARDEGLSLDGLAARTGCTKGCRLCEPYVRLALATGSMAFPVLHPLTIERMIAEAEEGA